MTPSDHIGARSGIRLTRTFNKSKAGRKVLLILLVCALHPLFPGKAGALSIKVSWNPAQVIPGGVVMLTVRSPVRLRSAEAATDLSRFPLLKVKGGTYVALVGIDMKPDRLKLPVDFTLFPARGGTPYRIRADLKVKHGASGAKRVQRLSLPNGMVDLSQKRISQVRRDNLTLGDALKIQSRQRFWEGSFILPLQGRITTRFGTGRILNGKQRSSHSGVDIAAEKGKDIRTANSGVIQLADEFFLSGKTVVVDHGWGVLTIYAHLDQIGVREGQRVVKGQAIGTVGETGRVTGPHLHFGAFIRGAKIDPLKLIEVTREFGIQDPATDNP